MTQRNIDSPVEADPLAESTAQLLDALSLFWRGARSDLWFAAWPDIWRAAAALDDANDDEKEDTEPAPELQALAVERAFAKCFYGVGDETIPLAQSCWETPEHTYGGRAALACTALYQHFGLKTDGTDHLSDDHVGVMLAFAAKLLRWGEWAALKPFLRQGLLGWWPKVIGALQRTAEGVTILPVAVATERVLRAALSMAEREPAPKVAESAKPSA